MRAFSIFTLNKYLNDDNTLLDFFIEILMKIVVKTNILLYSNYSRVLLLPEPKSGRSPPAQMRCSGALALLMKRVRFINRPGEGSQDPRLPLSPKV